MLHCPTCGRHYAPGILVCPEDKTNLQADSTVGGGPPIDPLIGHTLDEKYLLLERLGFGGMGTVYRARHLLIDRPVAVKVLNQRFVEDEAARIRFQREAKAAGRLQHPNAVSVTDFGQTVDGYVYIVMELLVGQTLREVLVKQGPFDAARAVALMLQIADAVAAAHDAGIIHRDLKPANIFIVQKSDSLSVVKVLDFGIAKLATEWVDEGDPTLTVLGAMIGTPRYMSPEQCEGSDLSPAADVYSLGVILYEMLTGTVPFSGSSPIAIAMKHTSEIPRSPRELVPGIPEELERVVLHALEKRPEDRPADAAAFRRELWSTAEHLGLENAANRTAADLATLREIGTESPSGRLIIDITRMRESVAATSSASEMTVLSSSAQGNETPSIADNSRYRHSFSRLAVPLSKARRSTRIALIASFAVLLLIASVTLFAVRSSNVVPQAVAIPSPAPTVEPSPSPSPSPVAIKAQQKPKDSNANNKKDSKVGSILKKAGRILKKPF